MINFIEKPCSVLRLVKTAVYRAVVKPFCFDGKTRIKVKLRVVRDPEKMLHRASQFIVFF